MLLQLLSTAIMCDSSHSCNYSEYCLQRIIFLAPRAARSHNHIKFYLVENLLAMNSDVKNSFSSFYPRHLSRLSEMAEKAMHAEHCDSILIHSGTPKLHFLDDYHSPFTANPHFVWWLPVTQSPHCYVLIQQGRKPVLFYHLADDFWHVPPQPPQGFWCDYFDIHYCANLTEVKQKLSQYRSTSTHRA